MKSYTDLLHEIEELKKENTALKRELARLKHTTSEDSYDSLNTVSAEENLMFPK